MKRIFFALSLFLCVCVALSSCQKAPVLTLSSPSNVELSADGSSSTITFTANRDWRANCSDSWVTVSPSSGTASDGPVSITVRCEVNTTYDDRTATVTISMEELSQRVTITQCQANGLFVETPVYELSGEKSSLDVEIKTNVEYVVTSEANWIKIIETKALNPTKITLNIEANESYDERSGTVYVKQINGALNGSISIKQEAKWIQFEDPDVKAALVAAFDEDRDKEISKEEAANVTSLDGVFGLKYYDFFPEGAMSMEEFDYYEAEFFKQYSKYTSFDEFRYFTGLKEVSDCLFDGWKNLRSIVLPNSITKILYSAFSDCSSLEHIVLSESLEEIGDGAFRSCGFSSICIPESVVTIVDNPFDSCTELERFEGKYASDNGRILLHDGKLEAFAPKGITSFEIPADVSTIGSGAFRCCAKLESITIPNTVKEISYSAFAACTNLKHITIPKSVEALRRSAFNNCIGLESVTLEEGLIYIEGGAFLSCKSLKEVTIPASVKHLGIMSFCYCGNLERVIVLCPDPPTEYEGVYQHSIFQDTNECPIYVPKESLEKYRSTWAEYSKRIYPLQS